MKVNKKHASQTLPGEKVKMAVQHGSTSSITIWQLLIIHDIMIESGYNTHPSGQVQYWWSGVQELPNKNALRTASSWGSRSFAVPCGVKMCQISLKPLKIFISRPRKQACVFFGKGPTSHFAPDFPQEDELNAADPPRRAAPEGPEGPEGPEVPEASWR